MESKLLLGDCLTLLPGLGDGVIDCIIADLPYGITQAKWDSEIPLERLWGEYKRVIKRGGPIILFGSQPFTSMLIASNLADFKYCWYWEKEKGTGFLNAKKQPLRCIEEICVFGGVGHYYPQMVLLDKPYRHKLPTIGTELTGAVASCSEVVQYKEYTHGYPKNLLRFARDGGGVHSTQKPLGLMEYLVKTYTVPGEMVLDNVMGSGTTCLACKNLGRGYIGMEKDEKFYEIAVKRLGVGQCDEPKVEQVQ
jgi:site-specific DNA-methyltransferase (adenine-specific)